MSKAQNKTAETYEFPTFDAAKATEQFRTLTEQGVEQSRQTYAKMKTNAEEAQKALESTFETAKTAGDEFALKSIAATRANTEAYFAHLEALIGASSLSETLELQTAFMRKQMEAALDQAKDFQAISTKAAGDISKPVKDAFEKTITELKVA